MELLFFKELLNFFFFFKGQAFPALEIRWGLSPCPQMPALEVTAEVENCEQVSLFSALKVNGRKV